MRQDTAYALNQRRRGQPFSLSIRQCIGNPKVFPRLRESMIQQIFLREQRILSAAFDFQPHGMQVQAIRIREQPLFPAAPWHTALICTQNIDRARIGKTVLVEIRNGHIVKPGRYQGHLQRIQPIPEQLLINSQLHFLIAADCHQLLEKLHDIVPDLCMLPAHGKIALCVCCLRPSCKL